MWALTVWPLDLCVQISSTRKKRKEKTFKFGKFPFEHRRTWFMSHWDFYVLHFSFCFLICFTATHFFGLSTKFYFIWVSSSLWFGWKHWGVFHFTFPGFVFVNLPPRVRLSELHAHNVLATFDANAINCFRCFYIKCTLMQQSTFVSLKLPLLPKKNK